MKDFLVGFLDHIYDMRGSQIIINRNCNTENFRFVLGVAKSLSIRADILGTVYMSPVCRANTIKPGARFHYNFLLKTILLYMQTGLARLGGISLDSNGAPGQPGLNLSMQMHKPGKPG